MVFSAENVANVVVRGFRRTDQAMLAVKTSGGADENGVCSESSDDNLFIQLDLGDVLRCRTLRCAAPALRIGGIKAKGGTCKIYGSSAKGVQGSLLLECTNQASTVGVVDIPVPSYDTTNKTVSGDLCKYGVCPFQFISVSGGGDSNLVLCRISFQACV